jgi:hypothetical protein
MPRCVYDELARGACNVSGDAHRLYDDVPSGGGGGGELGALRRRVQCHCQ